MARDDLLEQFLLEGRDLVARAADDLAALSADGADRPRLDGLFRTFHTLKGSAGLFDLPALIAMLHAAETRLESARDAGRIDNTAVLVCADMLDVMEAWLDLVEAGREADAELLGRTRAVGLEFAGHARPAIACPQAEGWSETLRASVDQQGVLVAIRYTPAADAYFRGDDPLAIVRAVPGLLKLSVTAGEGEGGVYDPFRCTLRLEALSSAPIMDVRTALRLVGDQVDCVALDAAPESGPTQAPTPLAAGGVALRSIRVDAERLDALAALIDELVIAKNALGQDDGLAADKEGLRSRDRANSRATLDRIVTDLHAAVSDLRLVELGRLFSRFPRQVREIASALGKEVEFLVSGASVAVDKSVVEGLYEPLLHLVRNALDHGLETPAARRAAGKRDRATLALSAQVVGEEITIDLGDDGRGLDIARIRQVATARGVASAAAVDELSDEEAADLIFAPGFSTADQVSDLSGRGVGMDAVRSALAQLGGRVALYNRPGKGLTVRLTLPAHVVLTKVLTVKAGGERFGVPLESIGEMYRVRTDEVQAIRASRAYLRREVVTPLLRLTDLLGLQAAIDPPSFPVLNLSIAGEPVGVQIDEIGDQLEAPLRPMTGLLAGFPGVLGTVMQRDGQVLLVLDMAELAS